MRQVFISYRHDNDAHAQAVRALAEKLRVAGLPVELDQFYLEAKPEGPSEGWPKWCVDRADKCHAVLIVASPGWFAAYNREDATVDDSNGKGLGAAAEAVVFLQNFFDTKWLNDRVRFVEVETTGRCTYPRELKGWRIFYPASKPADLQPMVAWLRQRMDGGGGPAAPNGPAPPNGLGAPDWPVEPPEFRWQNVADHSHAREAFERLVLRAAPFRMLAISGDPGTGKTLLTKTFEFHASSLPGVRFARFDFAQPAKMQEKLRIFAEQLDVPLPSPASGINAQLSEILASLKATPAPTLLIFDTYDQVGEVEQWFEDSLLRALIKTSHAWLRVAIVGQRVPTVDDKMWKNCSATPIPLRPPTVEEWFEFSRPFKPTMTLQFVREFHGYCEGRSALLAQLILSSSAAG